MQSSSDSESLDRIARARKVSRDGHLLEANKMPRGMSKSVRRRLRLLFSADVEMKPIVLQGSWMIDNRAAHMSICLCVLTSSTRLAGEVQPGCTWLGGVWWYRGGVAGSLAEMRVKRGKRKSCAAVHPGLVHIDSFFVFRFSLFACIQRRSTSTFQITKYKQVLYFQIFCEEC